MCFPSFRESKPAAKVVNTWERLPSNARERATAEKHLAWTLSWRDGWRTGVGRGTQTSEGVQASRNLMRLQPSYLFLHSITCLVLCFRSSLAFLMHMHGCRGGIPVGMASPDTHNNF